jgi:hypothetical protein
MVAGLDAGDALAHLDHLTRALVAQHDRKQPLQEGASAGVHLAPTSSITQSPKSAQVSGFMQILSFFNKVFNLNLHSKCFAGLC